jgi:hypothetical protein
VTCITCVPEFQVVALKAMLWYYLYLKMTYGQPRKC